MSRRAPTDLRCDCHRLLARGIAEGIELRCPRCKSNLVLGWGTLERLAGGGREVLRGRVDHD